MDPRLPLKFPLEIELRGFSDERLKSVGVLVKKADGSQQLLPMYAYVCIYMHLYVYITYYMHVYLLHTDRHTHTHTYTHTHTHMHTYKHVSASDFFPCINSQKSVV